MAEGKSWVLPSTCSTLDTVDLYYCPHSLEGPFVFFYNNFKTFMKILELVHL